MVKTYTTELAGRPLVMEFGKYCGQANGSVIVRLGDTVVMVNATASDTPREGQDFFPLSVDFDIAFLAVFAEDHAFIGVHARINEERSALLETVDGIGDRFSGTHADQHAVGPLGDFAAERGVF